MLKMKEIEELKDIKRLVDSFYGKVREDSLIGPIFNGVIQDQWELHLDKMYRFWQTVLLHEHTYSGSPFLPHAYLPVEQAHFDRWLALFRATLDEFFVGEKADEAKWRAERMAEMFYYKIQYYREHGGKPLM